MIYLLHCTLLNRNTSLEFMQRLDYRRWKCNRSGNGFPIQSILIYRPLLNHNKTHIFLEIMMTSSNGNIFRVTGPLCGEFTGPGEFPAQRPVTRGFDVFFDLRLNKRLGKQPQGWWFETPSWSLWSQCNVYWISSVSLQHFSSLIKMPWRQIDAWPSATTTANWLCGVTLIMTLHT